MGAFVCEWINSRVHLSVKVKKGKGYQKASWCYWLSCGCVRWWWLRRVEVMLWRILEVRLLLWPLKLSFQYTNSTNYSQSRGSLRNTIRRWRHSEHYRAVQSIPYADGEAEVSYRDCSVSDDPWVLLRQRNYCKVSAQLQNRKSDSYLFVEAIIQSASVHT